VTKRIHFRVGEGTGDEVEGQVEVGKREESEQELHKLIDEFDMEEDFAPDGVVGCPDLLEVKK